MRIERLDLNLFKVFQAILRNRSVSGAARELGVTPSAVSHALSRLRQAIGDELFVSGETGMEPTPRARELAPGVREGLQRISSAIGAKPFVASEAVRTVRVAASDYLAVTVLPRLVEVLVKEAPSLNLAIFPANRLDVVRELDDGRIDFVLGWFRALPDRVCRTVVMHDVETVVVRAGHPLTQGPVTREGLFAFPHVVVELTGSESNSADGFMDDRGVFRRIWIERLLVEAGDKDDDLIGRVGISVPYYSVVAPMLLVSDMVATLPRRLGTAAASKGDLILLDLPFEPLVVPVEAVWHQRSDGDPAIKWLMQRLSQVMEQDD